MALNITQRDFKWTFRTIPIAPDFAKAYTEFLTDLKTVNSIAVVNENTDYGTSVAASILDAANKAGIRVALHIPYSTNSTDASAQVLQLKAAQADASAVRRWKTLMKILKALDYLPPIIIGDDAGFSDPSFIPAVGDVAQGVIDRSAWDVGEPGSNTFKINQMFRLRRAEIWTTPAPAGSRAFWSSPTPSTARAPAIPQ